MYTTTASYFYGRDGGKGLLGIEGLAQDVNFLEDFFSDSPSYGGVAFHYYENIENGDSALRALGYEVHKRAPAVWVISPSYKEILSGIQTIDYVVYDPDGDALSITIEHSNDDGASWSSIANFSVSDQTNKLIYRTLSWDVSSIAPGNDHRLKITAIKATPEQLSACDQSDYPFSIVVSKTDTQSPAPVDNSTIKWSYDQSGEINLWWDESPNSEDVAGYYYSYTPNNPLMGSFTRGNRVRLDAPSADSMIYIWALDSSGNLSAPTSDEVMAIKDIDRDGVADNADNEEDRDGDGVSNYDESNEGTNPDDPLSFSDSRVIGHWMFEGDLNNSITSEPMLIIDNDNGNIVDGLLNYTNNTFLSGQAIEISGSEPVWLSLETNPGSHSNLDALTIEMWIKPDAASRDNLSFIPLACFGDIDKGLTLLLKNNSDLLSLRRHIKSGNGTYASINAQNDGLFDGEWHHVACSYNGYNGMLKLYIDGKLVGSGQKDPGSLQNTRVLRFFDGRSNYDDQNRSGDLYLYSGQFENNKFDFIEKSKIRYVGLVDNIKVTKASIPIELLDYYRDQSEDYNKWAEDIFGSDVDDPEINAPEVDYSRDGISNFLAYTSGLNPTINNSSNFAHVPIFETKGGQQYLSFQYLESKTATSSFRVQTNTTLDPPGWTNRTDLVSYTAGEFGNSWIKKVSVPFDGESDNLFMRLTTNMNNN